MQAIRSNSEVKQLIIINSGSATIKWSLYQAEREVLRGKIDHLSPGSSEPIHVRAIEADGRVSIDQELSSSDYWAALSWLLDWVTEQLERSRATAVVHRVVHGGIDFSGPVRVTRLILAQLKGLIPLAPYHQPQNLHPMEALLDRFPELLQVACFDTAFHRALPFKEKIFPIPRSFYEQGIQRFGFHGLSYQYVQQELLRIDPKIAMGKVVICHLGSGVSMCALKEGVSIATTMGLTPLDGLPMATRCGALDPGVLAYLIEERGLSLDNLKEILYRRSGLLGLSEISGDMRVLLKSKEKMAHEAIEIFCYRVARELGSLAAALNGLDCFVFSGGIGENSSEVRSSICDQTSWLGLELHTERNLRNESIISSTASRIPVYVIKTDEESVMASQAYDLLNRASP